MAPVFEGKVKGFLNFDFEWKSHKQEVGRIWSDACFCGIGGRGGWIWLDLVGLGLTGLDRVGFDGLDLPRKNGQAVEGFS
jgi:hypothetical protein